MDKYQKHLVDSINEAAKAAISKVDCWEKIDMVKIIKNTLKPIKENVNSEDCMPSKTAINQVIHQ